VGGKIVLARRLPMALRMTLAVPSTPGLRRGLVIVMVSHLPLH